MPQIGVRIEGHGREKDHYRLMKSVGRCDRNIERRIVERALSPLHPVHHAAITRVGRSGATDGDAGVVG